jgi:LysR family transcriptional regulator, glycine cleavage system transcriptional activator
MTVFEAAARHGRFTAAADELVMTQARVSQYISQLEAELGVELFFRRNRGVQLTSAGTALLESVERGMKTLADGLATVRRQAGQRSIQILTDYGFAAWWLMPRLAQLGELLPGVEVRLATTQAEIDATDAEFDLAIMFGRGEWSGFRTTPLFREEVLPVCSPAYLAGRDAPLSPSDIAGLRLLHLRGPSRDRWFTWADWFAAHEVAGSNGQQDLAFDNFQLVLQAALLGQGACIGWTPLIDDLVTGGGLVRLVDEPLRSTRGYHLVEHVGRPVSPNIDLLKAWLLGSRPGLKIATPPTRPVRGAVKLSQSNHLLNGDDDVDPARRSSQRA